MSIESEIFLKYTPDFKKLIDYGFAKKSKVYTIEKFFLDGFRAVIKVYDDGKIKGIVYDTENGDEYLPLRLENQEGSFVGKVRETYITMLEEIRNNCFTKNYFASNQGNRISDLICKKYGDKPIFMWEEYPTLGVFKNPESDKWYGLMMYIPWAKLDVKREGWIEVINIKLDKEEIIELLKKDGFYPAWHMNKKSWITLILDETLSDKKIMEYIEESHSYTVKKKKISRKV